MKPAHFSKIQACIDGKRATAFQQWIFEAHHMLSSLRDAAVTALRSVRMCTSSALAVKAI